MGTPHAQARFDLLYILIIVINTSRCNYWDQSKPDSRKEYISLYLELSIFYSFFNVK